MMIYIRRHIESSNFCQGKMFLSLLCFQEDYFCHCKILQKVGLKNLFEWNFLINDVKASSQYIITIF